MAAVTQWTDELYAEMSGEYTSRIEQFPEEERPGVSMEIVNELSKKHGVSPNGFRMKLSKEGIYIKKDAGAKKTEAGSSEPKAGGARTSKATAHAELRSAFTDAGLEESFLDDAIIDKLTGKAASHLAEAIRKITK